MTGHPFIVRGDITKLAGDAWLATSDAQEPSSRLSKHLGAIANDERYHGVVASNVTG